MANFSITGVGFPSPVSAAKSGSPPILHYQPLSSSFSPISQFPSPYFVQAQQLGAPSTTSTLAVPISIPASGIGMSPSFQPLDAVASPCLEETQDLRMAPDFSVGPESSLPPLSADFATLWQHHIPSTMPWVTNERPTDLTQFTASTVAAANSSETRYAASGFSPTKLMRMARRHKRKSDGYCSDCPPDKILVNEDRMAEKMRGLQLQASAKNTLQADKPGERCTGSQQLDKPSEEQWFCTIEDDGMAEDEETGEQICVSRGHRSRGAEPQLELSEELKRGLKQTDSLSDFIQEQLNKSQMQVVLWKPPGGHINDLFSKVAQGPSHGKENVSGTEKLLAEGRSEGDGTANVCIGRGEADGTAFCQQPLSSCGFQNDDVCSSFAKDFSRQHINNTRPLDLRMHPVNVKNASSNPATDQQLSIHQLDSSNLMLQQDPSPMNNAFSFTQQSTEQLAFPAHKTGQNFSFMNIQPDLYNGSSHLRSHGFSGDDLSACSTPREFVGMSQTVNNTQANSNMFGTLDDDMDL